MKAVILAGGMGTRLREETEFRPKPMVEIGGRPILWHIMKTLSSQGINDFVICLGYKGDYIKDFLGNCDRKVYAQLRDLNTKLKEENQLKPLNVDCISCNHKYEQTYVLNPTDFFD